ncbi:MAG: hypothetical protein AAED33_01615 [Paracoccaceae bacterium]|jgi:hypothetical protein
MFARVTKYKMNVGSRDEAITIMENLKSEIMTLNGIQQFINAGNEDGSGYIISIIGSKEESDSNAERVKDIWGNFGALLEEIPTPEGFDVMVNWSN